MNVFNLLLHKLRKARVEQQQGNVSAKENFAVVTIMKSRSVRVLPVTLREWKFKDLDDRNQAHAFNQKYASRIWKSSGENVKLKVNLRYNSTF